MIRPTIAPTSPSTGSPSSEGSRAGLKSVPAGEVSSVGHGSTAMSIRKGSLQVGPRFLDWIGDRSLVQPNLSFLFYQTTCKSCKNLSG